MKLADSLVRVRRLVRDTIGSVFSDALLIKVWDEVQQEFALSTEVLERVVNLSVPALVNSTYTQHWEKGYSALHSTLVYNFVSPYTHTQPWEPFVIAGVNSSVTGGATSTQFWERLYETVQGRIPHYFPGDHLNSLWAAYDNHPISFIRREDLSSVDSSFKTLSGTRPSLYVENRAGDVFFLYPQVEVTTGGITEIRDGDYGEIVYDDGGTFNPSTDYGVVTFGVAMDGDYGLVTRAQLEGNAIQLTYTYRPATVMTTTDTVEWPRWFLKYIEFGVLSKLFQMESDLFSVVLSNYYRKRYEIGLRLVSSYKSKRASVRTYKFEVGPSGRRPPRADLPSHYPSYWR